MPQSYDFIFISARDFQEKLQEKLRTHIFYIQVSQVTSGPRRGPTFNNRWWNDRRSWNLRTSIRREKSSPRGRTTLNLAPVRSLSLSLLSNSVVMLVNVSSNFQWALSLIPLELIDFDRYSRILIYTRNNFNAEFVNKSNFAISGYFNQT